jgi:hypothetical protein
VLVVDADAFEVTVDRRLWSADRIHATPLGHAHMAAAAAHALGLPVGEDWGQPLPPLAALPWWRAAAAEAGWAGSFLGPWAMRRLRGRSSGDGRVAKQPDLQPVRPR